MLLVNNIGVSDLLQLYLSTVKVRKRNLRKYDASKIKLVICLCARWPGYIKKVKNKGKTKVWNDDISKIFLSVTQAHSVRKENSGSVSSCVLESFSHEKLVYIQDRDINSFEIQTIKISGNETKWAAFWVKTHTDIP